jgi:hypothetical protein
MATTHQITHIKVDILINAKNRKRRIVFGLEKTTAADAVAWMIHFKIYEREDVKVDYTENDLLVKLDVEVDAALNAKAEKAAKLGFTAAQSAHAEGPAAADAQAAAAGEMDEADAAETIQNTLKKK